MRARNPGLPPENHAPPTQKKGTLPIPRHFPPRATATPRWLAEVLLAFILSNFPRVRALAVLVSGRRWTYTVRVARIQKGTCGDSAAGQKSGRIGTAV